MEGKKFGTVLLSPLREDERGGAGVFYFFAPLRKIRVKLDMFLETKLSETNSFKTDR